jgi:DNA-binding response OmpR family regulator
MGICAMPNVPATEIDVLIVEDDRLSRFALTRLLRDQNLRVDSAATLAEARQKLAHVPRCIVLDLDLPDGFGLDLLNNDSPVLQHARIAIVTGSIDASKLGDVRALGADVLFIKPILPANLLTWVCSAVTRKSPLTSTHPITGLTG